MEPFELLQVVDQVCERLGIRYATVGSLATIVYGEPRLTNDIDILVDLKSASLDDFCDAFPAPPYYLSRLAAQAAIRDRRQFNIIQTSAALKVDCILPASPFDQQQLMRSTRQQLRLGLEAVVATPEDVIIKKMEYYRLGGSDKHLRDIAGVLKVSGDQVDRTYVAAHAAQFGLSDIWQAILSRLGQS
jgi:hypothetical protein